MRQTKLSLLIEDLEIISLTGEKDREISGISYNSGKVKRGYLFAAIKGFHTDGHQYIPQALEQGAEVILHETDPAGFTPGITYLKVKDVKKSLSALSAKFYGEPSKKLKILGVTGTDGKSTTVWLAHQMLQLSGHKSGFISTVAYQVEETRTSNPYRQSTPEALEINALLAAMVDASKEYAVIESTSHGLSEKTARLLDIHFQGGIFTNITHEHLEFHGTFEQYRFDKANLFRKTESFGIINSNDPNGAYFAKASRAPCFTYGLNNKNADMRAELHSSDLNGSEFTITYNGETYPCRLNIPGTFNVENCLGAALGVIKLTGCPLKTITKLFPDLKGVSGRVEPVPTSLPFHVIVDYAHTPESFEKIFSLIKPMCKGRLITLFGSAGERDLIKRPIQGEVASRFSDIVIITDEDPRGENRMKILKEIAAGYKGKKEHLFLIPDRKEAIRHACRIARKDDTILLLGKGHESSIIYAEGPIPWNEKEVCREILAEIEN